MGKVATPTRNKKGQGSYQYISILVRLRFAATQQSTHIFAELIAFLIAISKKRTDFPFRNRYKFSNNSKRPATKRRKIKST